MQNPRENALIVFVKNPIKGKVKTRLAKTVGDENALKIYRVLLEHTQQLASRSNCDKFVFYDRFIPEKDIWNINAYHKYQQEGENLGQRMQHAFQVVFELGYKKGVIIGSDCWELETRDVENAFGLLDNAPIAIGPARDGGYYLLGMRKLFPELFRDISWSSTLVLQETLQKSKQAGTAYSLLRTLSDIDTEADLPKELEKIIHPLKNR